ncbi:hypothetical protein D1872_318960 [compost metagenome]
MDLVLAVYEVLEPLFNLVRFNVQQEAPLASPHSHNNCILRSTEPHEGAQERSIPADDNNLLWRIA